MKYKYLIFLFIVIIMEAVMTGIIPIYRGALYGALADKAPTIYYAIVNCFFVYLACDFFQSVKSYFVLQVALIFRSKRTEKIAHKAVESKLDNPSQRVQEDIKISYVNRIAVFCEYFISTTIVIQLVYLNLGEPTLILAAALYTLISVLIALRFNKKLTNTEKQVQKGEASFRTSLSKGFNFTSLIVANQSSIDASAIRTGYMLFTKLQLGLLNLVPYIVLVPSLLAGVIDMNQLMTHQGSFSLLVVNAAILIQCYTSLIQGKASEQRVKELENESK